MNREQRMGAILTMLKRQLTAAEGDALVAAEILEQTPRRLWGERTPTHLRCQAISIKHQIKDIERALEPDFIPELTATQRPHREEE